MGYNRAVKTDAGNELLSRVIAGETTITFTKIATSEKGIDEFEIKQEMSASATKFVKDEKVGVILDTVFSNTTLVEGYDINVIGVYAKDSDDNEIMFSYLTADGTPTYMEAFNGQVPQNVHIQIEAGIWLDDGSVIVIDQSGIATIEYVDNKIEEIKEKLESRVMVTLPADDGTNYTIMQDKDGADFYKKRFTVTGMTSTNNGTQPLTPVMVDPEDTDFSIAEWEEIRDSYYPLIMSAWGRDGGYVDIYLYDKPDKDFDVYLYGV